MFDCLSGFIFFVCKSRIMLGIGVENMGIFSLLEILRSKILCKKSKMIILYKLVMQRVAKCTVFVWCYWCYRHVAYPTENI